MAERSASAGDPASRPGPRPQGENGPSERGRAGGLPVGRLAGVRIAIHPLWLVIVGLITWSLGAQYYPDQVPGIHEGAAYALGLLSALLLFASILLHELGHAIVARRHGVAIDEIDLWLLGGMARMRGEPRRAQDELRFALAGPAVTLVIAAVFGVARLGLADSGPAWLRALLSYQLWINLAILGFNLLPAFPLDGGRVARALLWRRSGDQAAATRTAAALGRGFGFGLLALGVLSFLAGAIGGLWLGLVGYFLIVAAGSEAQRATARQLFGGRRVNDIMTVPVVSVPADVTIDTVIERYFAHHLYTTFPVVDAQGLVVGLLSIDMVRAVPAQDRALRRALEVAHHDPELLIEAQASLIDAVERPAFLRTGRLVVCSPTRQPIGTVSVTDLQRLRRTLELQ